MAFNALVGNTDDHPLNHGLLHDGGAQRSWHLASAFDITPAMSAAQPISAEGPMLFMATGADGSARAGVDRVSHYHYPSIATTKPRARIVVAYRTTRFIQPSSARSGQGRMPRSAHLKQERKANGLSIAGQIGAG